MPRARIPRQRLLSPILFGLFFVFLCAVGWRIYERARTVMEDRLRREIVSIVSIGALDLDEEIGVIRGVHGKEDMGAEGFRDLVRELRNIRDSSPQIRFAYIMRRTTDPRILEFVADADSLATDAELDRDGNGAVDENERASYPGDTYDVGGTPAMQDAAFREPTTDVEFSRDAWGTWMSGYAPIRDEGGAVVAILGIDVAADAFGQLARSVLPAVYLLAALGCILCIILSLTIFSLHSSRALAQAVADETGRKLRESTMLLETIIGHLPVALFCKDARDAYRFVLWNRHAEDIFGLRTKDVIGKNDYDFFPKDQSDFFRRTDEGVMAGGEVKDIAEETVDSPRLGSIILHTRKVPILDEDGKPRYLLGISEDITVRKAHEEELRRKTEETERVNRLMVGRETKMAEMKAEIERLRGTSPGAA